MKNSFQAPSCANCGKLFPFPFRIGVPRSYRVLVTILIAMFALPVVLPGTYYTGDQATLLYGYGIMGLGSFAGALLPINLYGGKQVEFYDAYFTVNNGKQILHSEITKIGTDGTKI